MATEPVNATEFQELARQALPKMYYDYYAGGAEDQYTLKENVEAFRRITIRPRILVDVSQVDLSTSILGYKTSAPIMIAPTGMHKLAHPEGEVATARAAAACNTIMALSFSSSCTLEEVASSCDADRFFQLYVYKMRDISALVVQRAERNGFKAIILTADTPRLGRREADIKNKMIVPPLRNLEGLISTDVVTDSGSNLEAYASATMDSSFCWKDIAWLKSITNLPILIKGVLTPEDGNFSVCPAFSNYVHSCKLDNLTQKDNSFGNLKILFYWVDPVGYKDRQSVFSGIMFSEPFSPSSIQVLLKYCHLST